uniref:Uncharacterized protein LOC105038823 n=1 Tax=Elaeis guineensis var. tenera TaxID=51953 RepID=A0A6I9QP62_ELAGV|nr:uncharacterized protein LOC105038823 [Elaeis guineensis]
MIRIRWDQMVRKQDAISTFVLKLRALRSKLRTWNHTEVGNIHLRKHLLWEKIEFLDAQEEDKNLLIAEREERARLKRDLDLLLEQEEALGRQLSRVQWLKHGDRNIQFFHTWASNRRRKNYISELSYQGTQITDPRQMHSYFRDHFMGILGRSEEPCVRTDWKVLYPEESLPSRDLEASFTVEEVKAAVFDLASQKSPRPDGFHLPSTSSVGTLLKQT